MLEKTFVNDELNIELTLYIDDKQDIWFMAKDIAQTLGDSNTNDAIIKHVSEKYQKTYPRVSRGQVRHQTFISEPGFYELIFKSKLPIAGKFRDWVFSHVLPSIGKYGQYKLLDNPNNKMFKIENETDLHTKVVDLVRKLYPDAIIVAGLGELQDTSSKSINSRKKGYTKGQPDLMIINFYKDYSSLCIEFKSSTNKYQVSYAQRKMKHIYRENGYYFLLSSDYDLIVKELDFKKCCFAQPTRQKRSDTRIIKKRNCSFKLGTM